MEYISVAPIHKNTKKSSLVIFRAFLKSSNFEGYIYIKQRGLSGLKKNYYEWMHIDYINMLRRARANAKPNYKPISQARWWLDHRVNCFKKGIRFSLNEAINFK